MNGIIQAVPANDAESVLARTPFLLTRCSADLRYLFVSEACARMLGRAPRQLVGRKIKDVIGESAFATILPHIEAVLAGETVEYESWIDYQGVGRRLMHVVYTPDPDGWVASITDITEKREAQEQASADLHAAELLRAVAAECVREDATLESCLDKVLDAAIEIAGADKGNVQLIDSRTLALRIAVQRGFDAPFLEFFSRVDDEASSACAAALKSGSWVIVSDVEDSPIFAGQPSLKVMAAEKMRAVISVPLGPHKGPILGMMSVHFSRVHQPSPRDLHLLDLLARLAADYLWRREAEETERLLLREVQHRSNNLLAVVQALAAASRPAKDFDAFEKRLGALARSNRLVARTVTGNIPVREIIAIQAEPFAGRLALEGPDVMISAQQAQDIGLVVHELITNAAKYGALSNQTGSVGITWSGRPGKLFTLIWKERGGPRVAKPARTGFGAKLLHSLFPQARLAYLPDGLFCHIEFKLNA